MAADSSLKILSLRLLLISSHTGKPCRNIGDVEDITHTSLLFHCNQYEIPYNNTPHVLACGLLDCLTFGLSYFWFVLLFIVASQITYQLIWSNCINKSILMPQGQHLEPHWWHCCASYVVSICLARHSWEAAFIVVSHVDYGARCQEFKSKHVLELWASYVTTMLS